jgi:hypothetical protein
MQETTLPACCLHALWIGGPEMRKFTIASIAAAGAYTALYHLGRSWGATREERRRCVPGDEMVSSPKLQTTHAITIDAPPEDVWPWLVQMGWGRAGWYTYRWVDRVLFPANGPSAREILPGLESLHKGDHVPDGPPESNCYFTVRKVEPPSLLVLHSDSHLFGVMAERDNVHMDWAWTWMLTRTSAGGTRLLQRNNGRLTPAWAAALYIAAIVPADFVMARGHLRGIKQRVESRRRGIAAQVNRDGASVWPVPYGRSGTIDPSVSHVQADAVKR